MAKFYITFGQKYRREPHPSGLFVHPDGWYEIEAAEVDDAREIAFASLGHFWAFIYSEDRFDKSLYPLGKLDSL